MAQSLSTRQIALYYAERIPELKQNGAGEWRCACPIHHGVRDSFAVDAETGRWYCHSECGRGGSIFDLEMAIAGVNFPTAKTNVLRILAEGTIGEHNGKSDADGNSAVVSAASAISQHDLVVLDQRIQKFANDNGWRHVCAYRYRDRNGRVAFFKAKFKDADGEKTFQKYALANGRWTTPKKAGIQPLLYNLHLLAEADEIHLCNGEKAANAGRKKLGLVTTCLPDGEANWDERFTPVFEGKRVIVPLDNDAKGRKHGQVVARALFGHASEIRLVDLPNLPPKGDLYDWIKAGGTAKKLRKIIAATPVVDAVPEDESDKHSKPKRRRSMAETDSTAFHVTDDAVLYIPHPGDEPLKICGPLKVVAFTRDAKGDAWGRLLKWMDAEGKEHEWAMPMSLLSGEGSEYRARLLDGGLFIAPGRKTRELLTVYIQTAHPEARALCVSRIGWNGANFVLPGSTIGPEGGEAVLFQTPYEAEQLLNVAGTLEEWQQKVGRFCSGNSRLILAASCAFAGPVLALAGEESGGVHLVGPSSIGKSTAQIVGGSVLGGGGRDGFLQSWRATANGLEAVAALHNDMCLYLDELAQLEPREASEIAYLLANGSGKQRMNRGTGARKKLTWSLIFVSGGEITLSEHAQTVGKRVRAGGEVRLLNIQADAGAKMGIFENIHGARDPDAFARQLKRAALRYYGAPLRVWLEFLTKDQSAAKTALRKIRIDFRKKYLPSGASGEVSRAAQRFALIGAAGELATVAGITGWAEGESMVAAAQCFQSWLKNRGTTGPADMEAAVRQVRMLLQAHGVPRFPLIGHDGNVHKDQVVRDQAGFRRKTDAGETEFLIFSEIFKTEFCKGYSWQAIAKELLSRGYLRRAESHNTIKVRLPGLKNPVRVYCVRETILKGDA